MRRRQNIASSRLLNNGQNMGFIEAMTLYADQGRQEHKYHLASHEPTYDVSYLTDMARVAETAIKIYCDAGMPELEQRQKEALDAFIAAQRAEFDAAARTVVDQLCNISLEGFAEALLAHDYTNLAL